MPSTGVPELRRSATSASSSSSRTRRIAAGKAPTPGRITPSAARTAWGSAVIEASAPDPLERLLDRAQIAHPVVEDRDLGHRDTRSGQGPLGGRDAGLERVDLDGLAQGPGERLEAGLDHVVRVGAVARADMQGQLRVGGDGAKELLRELGVEPGDRDRAAGRPRTGTAAARTRRSRTSRAPRPSGSRRTRSGGSRRGRPAPGRSPARARCRRPRPCGGPRSPGRRSPPRAARAARGGRAARACDRGSRPRSRPTPLPRRGRAPARPPSRGSCVRSLLCGSSSCGSSVR